MHALSITPVVGLPQVNGWSQVVDRVYARIHLVAVVAIQGDSAGSLGRDVVTQILEQQPFNAQTAYELVENLSEYSQSRGCQLSLTLILISEGRCILTSRFGSVWLKRQCKVGALVEADSETALIQGSAHSEDIFICATQTAHQFLPAIELQFGQGFDVDGVITSIVPAVHSLPESATAALAFINITPALSLRETSDDGDFTHQNNVRLEPGLTRPRSTVQPTQSYIPTQLRTTAIGSSPEEVQDDIPTESRVIDLDDEFFETKNSDNTRSKLFSPTSHADEVVQQPTIEIPSVNTTQSEGNLSPENLKKTGSSILKFIENIKNKVVLPFTLLSRLFSKRTYVDSRQSKKFLWWVIGSLVIVVGLLGSGGYYLWQLKNQRALAEELVAPFVTQLQQIQVVAENDPVTARQELDAALSNLVALQAQYSETGQAPVIKKIDEVIAQVRTVQQEISGKDQFSELPIFYDLRLASSDFVTSLATRQGGKAVFIDSQKKQLIVLDLASKQINSVAIESIDSVTAVSPLTEEAIALLANGVYSVALTADAQPATVKEVGDSNRAATLINTFGTYVYVFNPEKRNIYRYSEVDGKYSEPIGWLQAPLGVPFETVKSLMIDGDVWMSTSAGEILKFAAGKPTNFSITGMEEPFSSTVFLFTQEDTTNLYALEPEKKRVVIISKTGQFIREVRSDSLTSATNFFVSEQAGKAFAVSGSIVYEVAL